MGTCNRKINSSVVAEVAVKSIIGRGSSIWAKIGDAAEKARANVLHSPMAVAANRVGNK